MQASEKKNRWMEIPAFLLCVLCMAGVFSYLFDPLRLGMGEEVNERDVYILSALSLPENSLDAVILGDSEALVLASPDKLYEQTGISAAIIGQSGQTLSEAYDALVSVSRRQNLKLVILETDMITDESNIRRDLTESFNTAAYHYFPVLRYHGIWKGMLGQRKEDKIVHSRGFRERKEIVPYTGGEYMLPSEKKVHLPVTTRALLNRIVKFCRKEEITLLLVSAPSPGNYNMEKHNTLSAYAKEQELDYLDLNLLTEQIGISWETDMLDGDDHMNLSGSLKVTDYLAEYLQKENEAK